MYCKKCGAETADGSAFCTMCGAPVREQRQPAENAVRPDPTPIFVLGILSVVLPAIGGLICAVICRKKIKAYLAEGGKLTGLAKAGNILSIVGLALSIVTCVYVTVYLCILFAIYGTVVFTMIAGLLSYNFNY